MLTVKAVARGCPSVASGSRIVSLNFGLGRRKDLTRRPTDAADKDFHLSTSSALLITFPDMNAKADEGMPARIPFCCPLE